MILQNRVGVYGRESLALGEGCDELLSQMDQAVIDRPNPKRALAVGQQIDCAVHDAERIVGGRRRMRGDRCSNDAVNSRAGNLFNP